MDYFEATVARILEEQGYWVRENVRVALTKEVKKALNNPSMPRCEIDIVAYKPGTKELVLFEVKSYLDSFGVQPKDLRRADGKDNRVYLGPKEIAEAIWKFAELGYENSPFVLTAKLLSRHLPK